MSYSAGNFAELCTSLNLLSEDKKLVANFSKNSLQLFDRMFSAERIYLNMMLHAESIVQNYQDMHRQGIR